jgi:outer membrane protein OmpA-like peptidoglycan-associated protein
VHVVRDDDYYDDDDPPRRWPKIVAIGLVAALALAGGFALMNRGGDEEPGSDALFPAATEVTVADGADGANGGDGAEPGDGSVAPLAGSAATSASSSASDAADASTTTSTTPSATSVASTGATTPATTTPAAATAATPTSVTDSSVAVASAPGAGAPPAASTTAAAGGSSYPTSADGTPLPVLVTYDADTITLTGMVPSQAAKDRLGVLAVANSKTEAQLENNLVINPAVPIGVGVRVMELNSSRFPEGSAELLPEHASEFQRVADFMIAMPNVTAVVIGHADQRGDEAGNYEISAERAEAVVDFLTYLGVSPTRLSSRAVGEADLLSLEDDDTALALNRRTEFVLYGLLVE